MREIGWRSIVWNILSILDEKAVRLVHISLGYIQFVNTPDSFLTPETLVLASSEQ
jgi:hypothetical protein